MAIHDSGMPSIAKSSQWMESHKPYDRLSPPVAVGYAFPMAATCKARWTSHLRPPAILGSP